MWEQQQKKKDAITMLKRKVRIGNKTEMRKERKEAIS
jgi:hypothetical protein